MEWMKDFWSNGVISQILAVAIITLATIGFRCFLEWRKGKKLRKDLKELRNRKDSEEQKRNETFQKLKEQETSERLCRKKRSRKKKTFTSPLEDELKTIDEELKQINEKYDNKKNELTSACKNLKNWKLVILLLLAVILILGIVDFVIYKLYESNNSTDKKANMSELTLTPTITVTFATSPTFTPTPTVTPTPTYSPFAPFQEEGETIYGPLTMYLGMTAGELISEIGKPYTYQTWEDRETGSTGALWFDKDVKFVFCDSDDTLDMSCEVYMVWIQNSPDKEKVAKYLGNSLISTMDFDTLNYVSGFSLSELQVNRDNGDVVSRFQSGNTFFDFHWGLGGSHYDLDNAPELIIIYQVPPEKTSGAESIHDLINKYLEACQSGDFWTMGSLLWPTELVALENYVGVDMEDFNRILSHVLTDNIEEHRFALYPNDEFKYNYGSIEERTATDEDYDDLFALRPYKEASSKPDRIAIIQEVYLLVDSPTYGRIKYPFVSKEVVAMCFNGRWYLPSAYSGIWGRTMDDVLSQKHIWNLYDFRIE